jgi:endo-1,4-beta-D-glucanase Y
MALAGNTWKDKRSADKTESKMKIMAKKEVLRQERILSKVCIWLEKF